MQIESRTLQLLKNFSGINPSIAFKSGSVLKTMSPTKTIIAQANVEEEFPQEFAIHDLSKFLAVLSLFDKPELGFEPKLVTIASGKNKVKYTYCDPKHITLPPAKELKLPTSDVQFTLTPEMFSSTIKAMSVLGLPELLVVGSDGVLSLQAADTKNKSGDTYVIEIGETDKNFTAIFKAENLKILPGTYEVTISSKGFSHFKGDKLDYWIAIEATSTFE